MLKKALGSHELTPLQIPINTIPNYAALDSTDTQTKGNNISITSCDLSLFTLSQWNMYLSRTIVYPFATIFAFSYNMTPSTFSYIMSAFDFGGCIAVLLTLLPRFNRIPIRYCMFIVLIMCCILNLAMSIWTTFIALFCIRLLTGIFATIGSAEIRGSLGATLKNKSSELQSRLTFGVMLIESAWCIATFGWMFIGIGIHEISVNFAWYIISCSTLLACILSYFLPDFSIYQATPGHRQIMSASASNTSIGGLVKKHHSTIKSMSKMLNYELYILYLGMFMNGIPFYCFFSTFGGFMQETFNLNSAQLGSITLTITAGEFSALISSSCIAKFKSNMFIVILGSCCGAMVFSVFVIMLNFKCLTLVNAMVILYLFTYTIELSYLNSIVCTLHFATPGYETTASLIGQFVSRSSSIFAVIIGVHIVEWMSFQFLIQMLIIAQLISIVIFWWLYKLYSNKKNHQVDI